MIPECLKEADQWVVWKRVPKDNGKSDKIPYNPKTKLKARHSDPATWGTFDEALKGGFDGAGFVFTEYDPYTGIDFDDCRDPETGVIQDWAQKWIDLFSSYSEISQSGKGIHIIIKGRLPVINGHTGLTQLDFYQKEE